MYDFRVRRISWAVAAFTILVLFSATLGACAAPLPKQQITIGKNTLVVEIASTPSERQKGLMRRKSMPENHGMLFIFPKDEQLSFWMKNTLIPLSIAYISSNGTIKSITDMKPDSLDPIVSDYSVRYALEVNQGYFSRHGIRIGDVVKLPSDLPRSTR